MIHHLFIRRNMGLLFFLAVANMGWALQPGTHAAVPLGRSAAPYGHYLYLPESYRQKTEQAYPLLIFLHGSGERANSATDEAVLDKVLVHGPPKLIESRQWQPAEEMVVVSPQCHENWWNSDSIMRLIDVMSTTYRIDPARIYLTGLSMGGFAVFEYLSLFGDEAKVAAAVAICGKGTLSEFNNRNLSHTPLWVFHGDQDRNVSDVYAKQAVPAINALGPAVSARLTMFPGIGHDSWTMTYDGTGQGKEDPVHDAFDQDVFTWMLSHRLVPKAAPARPLNYVVIFCDDLGYGDLGVYGHPNIRTPNIDRMAREGQRWTNFYAAASVCTPSRAGMLTGRLPVRNGMTSDRHRVLFPESKGGLPNEEITMAAHLKGNGYRTACIGKWHLGHQDRFMPLSHGFDYFYGIKYSNDMDRNPDIPYEEACLNPQIDYFQVELFRNREVIEQPVYQPDLTRKLTREAVQFVRENRDSTFFLYFAHPMPHVPLYRSARFEGVSKAGIYGDVIEELDWSVGQVLEAIELNGLRENTVVVFTSDNGPWLKFETHGGSAGTLQDGKGSTFEGGMRVPAIFWSPTRIRPDVVMEMGATTDLFATFSALSGIAMPTDRRYDSEDLSSIFKRGASGRSPRQSMFYYRGERVFAVRQGRYKAHFLTQPAYGGGEAGERTVPLLFDLDTDPGERYDIAAGYPDIIEALRAMVAEHRKTLRATTNQLDLY